MPLHTDFQIYGWCSVPLLGVLLINYLPDRQSSLRLAAALLIIWSIALLVSGVFWLNAHISGKIFLEWDQVTRQLFPDVLAVLWLVLAVAFAVRCRSSAPQACDSRKSIVLKLILLALLATVPGALYFALSVDVYPAINPHSGGPTGASLLASTLGIVALFAVIPPLLFLSHTPALFKRRRVHVLVAALVLEITIYALIEHGNSSHHDLRQIGALASLLVWIPIIAGYYHLFPWNKQAVLWLRAFGFWGDRSAAVVLSTYNPALNVHSGNTGRAGLSPLCGSLCARGGTLLLATLSLPNCENRPGNAYLLRLVGDCSGSPISCRFRFHCCCSRVSCPRVAECRSMRCHTRCGAVVFCLPRNQE